MRKKEIMSGPQKNSVPKGIAQKKLDFGAYELPLYQNRWSIFLQLIMLDALELFGCQNWYMVAKYMNCEFCPQEISQHYYRIYGNHQVQNQYKLYEGTRYQMLIDHPEYDIYIAAQKRQQTTKQHQSHPKPHPSSSTFNPLTFKSSLPSIPTLSIPPQFGYQPQKHSFMQPFHQQAQIMILNLEFTQQDTPQKRKDKINVLKAYDKFVSQRAIVQREVIQNGLLECKYYIKKDELSVRIPKELRDEGEASGSARGDSNRKKSSRSRGKGKSKSTNKSNNKRQQKSNYIQKQLFFRISRKMNQGLCDGLNVVYTKIKKYDRMQKMLTLMQQFQETQKEALHLKNKIQSEL